MKLVLYFLVCVTTCLSIPLDQDWWKYTEIYDIPIWQFKDSDSDGIGDINGVTSKLDYLEELGINTIKLSPIFSSVHDINPTYPINDFQKIHISLGQMEDFDNLMAVARNKGIKVILDFVINHCSTYHEWFEKSQRRIDPYTDYFIWKDKPKSYYNSEHWSFNAIRKQMYYHYYGESADLNFGNEAVKEEIKKLIKFWFDKGVSGLNLLSANVSVETFSSSEDLESDNRITEDRLESYEFVHELREYVDSYNKENGGYERILMVDEKPPSGLPDLHGNKTYPIAHIVYKNAFDYFEKDMNYLDKAYMNSVVLLAETEKKTGPRLIISESADEESYRLPNRFANQQFIDLWLTLVYMLPSPVHIYYGQEIGLADCRVKSHELARQRPFSSAMQWDDSLMAGFTDSEFTLMPPNTDYWYNNVKKSKNNEFSRYNMVKELLKLRKTETVKNGNVKTTDISNWVYAFTRSYEDKETYIVIFNLENKSNSITLQDNFKDLPEKVEVVVSSPNSVHLKGSFVGTSTPIMLRPTSCIVIEIKQS